MNVDINAKERLLMKFCAWLLAMFILFEFGLQIGLNKGRKLGRIEAADGADDRSVMSMYYTKEALHETPVRDVRQALLPNTP